MLRLRPHYTDWPRPRLELTESPDPNCPHCFGEGGLLYGYVDWETGECDGESEPCSCWNPFHTWRIVNVPRWAARRWLGWREPVYSEEPPF